MYECINCGQCAVIWDCDFSFEDFGIEGEGLVATYHCTNCGAEITYAIPFDEENMED